MFKIKFSFLTFSLPRFKAQSGYTVVTKR